MKTNALLIFLLIYGVSNAQEHHAGISAGLSERETYEHFEKVIVS